MTLNLQEKKLDPFTAMIDIRIMQWAQRLLVCQPSLPEHRPSGGTSEAGTFPRGAESSGTFASPVRHNPEPNRAMPVKPTMSELKAKEEEGDSVAKRPDTPPENIKVMEKKLANQSELRIRVPKKRKTEEPKRSDTDIIINAGAKQRSVQSDETIRRKELGQRIRHEELSTASDTMEKVKNAIEIFMKQIDTEHALKKMNASLDKIRKPQNCEVDTSDNLNALQEKKRVVDEAIQAQTQLLGAVKTIGRTLGTLEDLYQQMRDSRRMDRK